MKLLLVFLACLATAFSAAVKRQECTTSADCQSNECCALEPNPFMVSKRELQPVPQPIELWKPKKYCYSYIQENEWCGGFQTTCGCASGLSCQDVFKPINLVPIQEVSKRDIRPGDWRCTKVQQ
ncbi:U3-aranetoxin-Ce1a isoform X2 [Lingula anatina]|uniref:U3-aranetoxin-Ce1a isoform X1 n=1 Tax=Lingula anatina TaxID=7574 RepID=A0A1S3HV66_LINAN|nr:U3-aranetoxin-Ce1a isoform X1 [Lingula anatina]XP_013388949.1 U3-aranetoxin-Ce1a isoform X2 [Lingula anatina]|eukprot:XP_013388948.1 U3-aranetoxin-Ce1a isoform X1 [Lingula anatina]